MAAPLRITDVTSGLLGGEDGRVYIYNGKNATLGDMTGKCKSWMTPCPEEKVRVGYRSHDGGGPVFSQWPAGSELCWCFWSWSPVGLGSCSQLAIA